MHPVLGKPVNATKAKPGPATISGRTHFDVTLAANPNYPNPPGWGVSYYINTLESAVLEVYRGVNYTFNVTVSAAAEYCCH